MPAMKQTIKSEQAIELIQDGARVMIGGFMGVGSPDRLIDSLAHSGKKNLTLIANDTALPERGIGKLISAGIFSKIIVSHIGLNPETQQQMKDGSLAVELVPQGTLVESIRAAGVGLGGILTPTGIGTPVAEGKSLITVDGKDYLLEPPLSADVALIAARQSDYVGNLEYTLTAQNFNPLMAMACQTVIAEPQHIVPIGMIPPDSVRTPGVLIDYLIERPH